MQNPIIELVVYRLHGKSSVNQSIITEKTNQALAQMQGFLSRKVYQCLDDETLLFDLVEWDNLKNAENAAQSMMQVPDLLAFVQLIAKTEIFEHFSIEQKHSIQNQTSPIVELVMYELKQDANVQHFFDTYSQEIQSFEGYFQRILLNSFKNKQVFGERVFWNNLQNAQDAVAKMEKNEVLASAFSMVEKVIMMKHFQEIQ